MPHIEISIVRLPQDFKNFDLVAGFLKFRKSIFIDRMAWPLHHSDGIEFEQYDTFSDTAYVIAHIKGEILGGARLKRTDKLTCNGKVQYSYMIRDAHLGLLPGMPNDLCYNDPPVDQSCWELTRLASEPISGLSERILEAANDYLFSIDASECLFLGPPAFLRMASKMGWTPKPLGAIVKNDDGRFLAFSCPVRQPDGALGRFA